MSGRRDRRAWSLGVYFLDVACTLAEPLVRRWSDPSQLTSAGAAATHRCLSGRDAVVLRRGVPATLVVELVVARVSRWLCGRVERRALRSSGSTCFPRRPFAPFGRGLGGWYFGVQYLALPLLAITLWRKLRSLPREERARTYLLAIAIGAMAGCLLLVTTPARHARFGALSRIGRSVDGAFSISIGVLPAVATYAALVQRVLPITVSSAPPRNICCRSRSSMRWRPCPFVAAVAYLFLNRQRAVGDVFSGRPARCCCLAARSGGAC